MANATEDKDFLEFIIKALVDNPDKVEVTRTVDEMGVLLTLKVDPKDMGRIIGRAGATARAIRSLTRLVGLRNNARVNLKIVEPEGSEGQTRPTKPTRIKSDGRKSADEVIEDLKNI